LTLCAKVLASYELVELSELPRMADFARILRAIDIVRGTDSLASYLDEIGKMASNSIEGDNFFKAVKQVITSTWTGTAADLLELTYSERPLPPDKFWPNTPAEVTGRLIRTSPTLRKVGWQIDDLGSNNERKIKKWRITPNTGVTGVVFTLHTKGKGEEDSAAL